MSIKLLREGNKGLDNIYLKDGEFTKHYTGKSINILPFTTKYETAFEPDLNNFTGIVGQCFRISLNKELDDSFKKDENKSLKEKLKEYVLKKIKENVETENIDQLEDIILKLFFEENDNLTKFNKKVLPYMSFHYDEPPLNEIPQFIYEIFLGRNTLTEETLETENNNLFYQLILESLPNFIEKKKPKKLKYLNLFADLKSLFLKDFNFLASNEELFLNHIEELFKYYYFLYLSQLSIRLNSYGITNKITPIKFALEWEKLSESRHAYKYGWKKLSYNLNGLFAHANALEFLNYIEIDGEPLGDYNQAKEKMKSLSPEERTKLVEKIKEVSNFYKTHVYNFQQGYSWEKCDNDIKSFLERHSTKYNDELTREFVIFHKRLDYLLSNSSRKSAMDKYEKWLFLFCKNNYTKARGRLGSITMIDQDFLLFISRLCVGNEEKIRLKELWERLEIRGLSFDETSKNEIIKLFERINLLEKKSDSGDAQYVKSII